VDIVAMQCHPEQLYISAKDATTLKLNIKRLLRKQNPYSSKVKLHMFACTQWLNYGPNESLSDAIKPGYVMIKD